MVDLWQRYHPVATGVGNALGQYKEFLKDHWSTILKDPAQGFYNALSNTYSAVPSDRGINALNQYLQTGEVPEGMPKVDMNQIGAETFDMVFPIAGTIAGVGAKTAIPQATKFAQSMKRAGVPEDEIFRRTHNAFGQGWWLGHPDTKPRFEIDDSGADYFGAFLPESTSAGLAYQTGRLKDAFPHNDLYAGYPELEKLWYTKHPNTDPSGARAQYREPGGIYDDDYGSITAWKGGGNKSTTLHETQHAVSGREGFSRGGSPEMFVRDVQVANELIGEVNSELSKLAKEKNRIARTIPKKSGDMDTLKELQDSYNHLMSYKLNDLVPRAQSDPYQQYRRLADESQARLTQSRMDMTAAERAAPGNEFYKQYDVPLNEMILRYGRGSNAMALPSIEDFAATTKTKHGLDSFDIHEKGNTITLSMFEVPKGQRKTGLGSAAMEDLTSYADKAGKRVYLNPGLKDDLHGTTSRSRLVKFYKRFGFVENKGRNKDFTMMGGMYRDPTETNAMASLPMDEASRMQRAKEMGFSDEYGGIDLFKRNRLPSEVENKLIESGAIPRTGDLNPEQIGAATRYLQRDAEYFNTMTDILRDQEIYEQWARSEGLDPEAFARTVEPPEAFDRALDKGIFPQSREEAERNARVYAEAQDKANAALESFTEYRGKLPKSDRFQTGKPVGVNVFHASRSPDIEEMDMELLGSNTGAKSAKGGVFAAGSPKTANSLSYTGLVDETPLRDLDRWEYEKLRTDIMEHGSDFMDGDMFFDQWEEAIGNRESWAEDLYYDFMQKELPTDSVPTMYPLKMKFKNPYVYDMKGSRYREVTYAEIIDKAKKAGHDGAIIKNTYDGGKLDNIFVSFKPKNIRSKFAAFDPAKKDSSNILAGAAGAGVGLTHWSQILNGEDNALQQTQ